MNEAAKATILDRLTRLNADAGVVDFDWGTKAGEKAADQAIIEFIYEDPEQVADRPALGTTQDSRL